MYFSEHQNDCPRVEHGMRVCLVNSIRMDQRGVVKGGRDMRGELQSL